MASIASALLFLLVPALMLALIHYQRWAQKLGVILLCYLSGLIVGNAGLVPAQMFAVQALLSEVAVALALPMLLFTLDIRQWSKSAGKAILSMLFAIVSVVTLATTLFYLFRAEGVQTTSQFAAMSVGMYTGGTPNIAAIKTALDIPHARYIVFQTLDALSGGIYILAMLTFGIPLFRKLLGRPGLSTTDTCASNEMLNEDYLPLTRAENLPQLASVFLLALFALGASLGLAELVKAVFAVENTSAFVIIFLTTIGMAFSLNARVRQLVLSYRTGMYLIYVFCFVIATMTNAADLGKASVSVTMFVFGTIAGSLLIHAILCKLAGIDGDTFVITSTAAICSPPFVPMMAKALGNPSIVLSGMTTGIIGYALGNYLGIALALLLQ